MYCQLFKSHLAVIESEREQNFVEGLLRREYHQGNKAIFVCVFLGDDLKKNTSDTICTGSEWDKIQTSSLFNGILIFQITI